MSNWMFAFSKYYAYKYNSDLFIHNVGLLLTFWLCRKELNSYKVDIKNCSWISTYVRSNNRSINSIQIDMNNSYIVTNPKDTNGHLCCRPPLSGRYVPTHTHNTTVGGHFYSYYLFFALCRKYITHTI